MIILLISVLPINVSSDLEENGIQYEFLIYDYPSFQLLAQLTYDIYDPFLYNYDQYQNLFRTADKIGIHNFLDNGSLSLLIDDFLPNEELSSIFSPFGSGVTQQEETVTQFVYYSETEAIVGLPIHEISKNRANQPNVTDISFDITSTNLFTGNETIQVQSLYDLMVQNELLDLTDDVIPGLQIKFVAAASSQNKFGYLVTQDYEFPDEIEYYFLQIPLKGDAQPEVYPLMNNNDSDWDLSKIMLNSNENSLLSPHNLIDTGDSIEMGNISNYDLTNLKETVIAFDESGEVVFHDFRKDLLLYSTDFLHVLNVTNKVDTDIYFSSDDFYSSYLFEKFLVLVNPGIIYVSTGGAFPLLRIAVLVAFILLALVVVFALRNRKITIG